ncbi:MAG: AMP-binding protein [Prevotella sp.]|nr:AMP-binding protein [Prevotella sp.]
MSLEEFLEEWNNSSPYVHVQTSGSTGAPKPMLVEKRRMLNSARITCDFLGLHEGDTALLCMSLDYIAGKMMVVRSLERGLKLIVQEPSGHPLGHRGTVPRVSSVANYTGTVLSVSPSIDFAAMVPMQVYNSLQVPEERERLMQIKNLIIGGGAIDDALAAELKTFPHAVWSTYGMTETLSHIALRRLSGPEASEFYTPFPGVRLSLSPEDCLIIDAPEVCPDPLVTNDIAELTQGDCPLCEQRSGLHRDCPLCVSPHFRILGRKDSIICSGGLKIQAEELERQLRPYLRVPYLISKRPDAKFGEIVVLLTEGSVNEAREVCQRVLPKYHQPRAYIHLDQIPLTETDKPARFRAHEVSDAM